MHELEYKNLKLILSWNGAKFSGYQFQPHAFTVQEALTNAWKILNKEDVSLCGCSRLDAGVHAQYYVLNFQTKTSLNEERILKGLNGILRSNLSLEICVYGAQFVHSDFHSRFHSKGKHYRYLIWHGFAEHSLLTKRCWHVRGKITFDNVTNSLVQFVGKHDFNAFRSTDCVAKTTVRQIYKIDSWVHPIYPEMLIVDIWGDGFLKNMIRNIIGTSIDIATGKLAKNTITESFLHKDRTKTGMCSPPWALSLMHVYYELNELEKEYKKGARHLVPC